MNFEREFLFLWYKFLSLSLGRREVYRFKEVVGRRKNYLSSTYYASDIVFSARDTAVKERGRDLCLS